MTKDEEAEIRAEVERSGELVVPIGHAQDLLDAIDEARGAAERAEAERDEARAQLAALREAVERALLCGALRLVDTPEEAAAARALETATYDAGAAAEAYTRRIALAGECRGMRLAADMCCSADDIGDGGGAISAALEQVADRLSARADEIERGQR